MLLNWSVLEEADGLQQSFQGFSESMVNASQSVKNIILKQTLVIKLAKI